MAYNYRNEKNIEIFNDTMEVVKELQLEGKSNTFKYNFDNIIDPNKISKKRKGNISVYPKDTISTAIDMGRGKTCILNMASPRRAGGGVWKGTVAQEECLFRSTNLFQTIVQDFYPLKIDEALYTTDSYIVKDFYYNVLSTPMRVDCITIAALEPRSKGRPDNYVEIMKQKIRLMLSLAYHSKVSVLVLGAWGCGVFGNDPKEVATMFRDVLNEGYRYAFDETVFGIINDRNSVDNNVNIFTNILNV